MTDKRKANRREAQAEMIKQVRDKEARKVRARRTKDRGVWFGLGMMGMIGWSVAVPTLVGVALGAWIDGRWPSRFSWTLALLLLGLVLGCLNAWHWVVREQGIMEQEREEQQGD